jgi:hypothetical protein
MVVLAFVTPGTLMINGNTGAFFPQGIFVEIVLFAHMKAVIGGQYHQSIVFEVGLIEGIHHLADVVVNCGYTGQDRPASSVLIRLLRCRRRQLIWLNIFAPISRVKTS